MVNSCCVFKCTKRQGRDKVVYFFSIPAVIEYQGAKTKELSFKRHQAWILNINRKEWTPSKSSRVCSEHFLSGKLYNNNYMELNCKYFNVGASFIGRPAPLYDSTNPDWVPSLKMGYETSHTPDQERYTRLCLRKKRKIDAVEDEDLETGVACQADIHVDVVDAVCQTDLDMFEVTRMEKELQQLFEDRQSAPTN